MGVGFVSALAFDPWAALKTHHETRPLPNPANSPDPPAPEWLGLGVLAALGGGHPSPSHSHASQPVFPGVPKVWGDGVARLATMPPPSSIPSVRWLAYAATASRLLHKHGVALYSAGWDTVDVFGLHHSAPARNPSGWGLAWLLADKRGRCWMWLLMWWQCGGAWTGCS